MYKSRSTAPNAIGYVESDPSGRYGRPRKSVPIDEQYMNLLPYKVLIRFKEVLGEGAMKTVYRAFDEVLGMEVAWNQVKLKEAFHSPDLLQRLYSEVHLLKNLNHCSIIRFHTHWIDIHSRSFNFITEMFTSGTLREYRRKYQQVDIRAVKNWARQILRGLAYLHEHDPPVIHRDLKCDNIFVNGHLGQVKIGDLGLAAILQGCQQAHSVIGTPEFMAPELYEEEYNELVDIYSFGMCVLEMLTSEYPYSECSNPAQIYKKVTSGKLPQAFYRIQDKELQQFVERCIGPASKRSSARELLLDPFLSPESLLPGGTVIEAPPLRSKDMTITGTMNSEDDTIFLKVQITDQDGQSNNIYFPFDIVKDTAIDVANEMVKELEICGWEPMEISKMIEEQITSLLPGWKQFGSPQFHDHLGFNYQEEEDVNITPCPLYADSLFSSSSSSLPPLNPSHETQDLHGLGAISSHDCWLQGNLYIDDDEKSTNNSLSSFMHSNINYASDCEDKYEFNSRGENPQWISKMGRKDMYRQGALTKMDSHRNHGRNSNMRNPSEVRSFVDVRSQLLHWSLVEKISERRQFKTVGGVEKVGFQQP